MKRYFKLLFAVSFLVLLACEDPYKNSTYQIYNENPISTYLASNENYSEWVKVLRYADLFNALNQADQDFTAFVPTNAAVDSFYHKMNVNSIEDLGEEYAKSMVLYSTVLDTISVEDFVNLTYTTNISGDQLSVKIDSTVAGEAILDGQARVVQMCISVSNGVIYVLGDVMQPLVETVYDRVAHNSAYSIMTQAIEETGWSSALNTLADTVIVAGSKQITRRNYTLLAVSDAAFAKDSIHSLADLKVKLNAQGAATSDTNALNLYVAYHILASNYKLQDLETFNGADTSVIWNTLALNKVLMITLDSLSAQKYILNLMGSQAGFVTENSNILAKNGYLHELDRYLPVWEPEQTTVLWDLTDYSEVKNIVGPSLYQPAAPVSVESKVSLADATCYTYEVSPSGVVGTTYSYVSYVNCKALLNKANKYDRLVLNLGYMGSLSMKTPTLVRGKYKVSLKFIYLSDHSFMRTMSDGNGGLMKITFDDANTKNVSPYTTVTSTLAGVYESTLYEEISFTETTSHTFKLIIMDPAASSNSKFSLQLDAIIFTPVTQ
jgi:uncharacterized surface protein with fasciclin (FAS1) repeats